MGKFQFVSNKVAGSAVDTTDDELVSHSCLSDLSDSYLEFVPPVVRSQSVALTTEDVEVSGTRVLEIFCL